jgi:hypothetical protein
MIASPLVIAVLFVRAYGVNVPIWDEWESVPDILAVLSRRLTLGDLWRQHNEHRIFFPRIAMLALYRLGHMDSRVLMYANCGILAATVAIVLIDHLRCSGNTFSAWLSFVPAAWILSSLRQWENLLWAWQIQIFMCVGAVVVALYALSYADRIGWMALGIAAGVVACCSFSSGMLVWPAGLFQILVRHRQRSRWRAALIWCCAAIATAATYSVGYQRPQHHPSPLAFLQHPINAATYLLASIGGPLAGDLGGAVAAGLLLSTVALLAARLWYRRPDLVRPSMAASLIVFSVGASAMMMIGRVGFGPSQALASRYTTITVLGVAGLYLLIVQNLHAESRAPRIVAAILAIAFVGQASVTDRSIAEAKVTNQHRRQLAIVLKGYRSQPDEMLAALYPVPSTLRERAAVLEQFRLSVFARAAGLASLPGIPPFSVDFINNAPPTRVPSVRAGTMLRVSGWAVDDRARTVAAGVVVFVDGGAETAALYGLERPDVAQVLGNPGYRDCGFTADAPTLSLAPGRHSLGLRIFNADGTGFYEPPVRFFFDIR